MDRTFGRQLWAPAKVWGLIAATYGVCGLVLLLPRSQACLGSPQWQDSAALLIAIAAVALATMVGVADRRRLIFVFPAIALATLCVVAAIADMAAAGQFTHPVPEGRVSDIKSGVSDICFVAT